MKRALAAMACALAFVGCAAPPTPEEKFVEVVETQTHHDYDDSKLVELGNLVCEIVRDEGVDFLVTAGFYYDWDPEVLGIVLGAASITLCPDIEEEVRRL